jgi:ribosomal-protein-alanine N-acetyltransferase
MFGRISSVFWVARLGPKVVGHLLMNVVEGECEILSFAIEKDMRRRGIGRELMARALRVSAPSDVFLDVSESNRAAIALYTGLGFRIVGRRKRYYPTGEDALLMRSSPGDEGDGS